MQLRRWFGLGGALLLLCGCGPELSPDELGRIIYRVPEVEPTEEESREQATAQPDKPAEPPDSPSAEKPVAATEESPDESTAENSSP